MIKTGFLSFILELSNKDPKQHDNIQEKQKQLEILYLYFSFILRTSFTKINMYYNNISIFIYKNMGEKNHLILTKYLNKQSKNKLFSTN